MILKIDNYVITPGKFIAGTRGSYGIETVDLELSREWDGLSVTVSFYPAGADPVSIIYKGEPFYIPWEVMNRSGTCKYVVSGVKDEHTLVTAEGLLRVISTSTPTTNIAESPTPGLYAQILAAMEGKADSNHNHDGSYAPANGVAPGLTAGLAENLAGEYFGEYEGQLNNHEVNDRKQDREISAGHIEEIDGMSVLQILENGDFSTKTGWMCNNAGLSVSDNVGTVSIDLRNNPALSQNDFIHPAGGIPLELPYPGNEYSLFFDDVDVEYASLSVNSDTGNWQIIGYEVGTVVVNVCGTKTNQTNYDYQIMIDFTEGRFADICALQKTVSLTEGHKYYFHAEVKSPNERGGIAFGVRMNQKFIDLGRARGGDWETLSGVCDSTKSHTGYLSIYDNRRVTTKASWVCPNIELVFASCPVRMAQFVRAYDPSFSGDYVLTCYSENDRWSLRLPNGNVIDATPDDCGLIIIPKDDGVSLNGAVITVHLDFPFTFSGSASVYADSSSCLTNESVDLGLLMGSVGNGVFSEDGVEFEYFDGEWTRYSYPVDLESMGITGTWTGTPEEGALISIYCSPTHEPFWVRNVQVSDLTVMGLEDLTVEELDKFFSGYNSDGISGVKVGGIACLDAKGKELPGRVEFSKNYELFRLPNQTSDRLDIVNGKFIRHIGKQTVSGSNGSLITLNGAKNGTVCLSLTGKDIGNVVGKHLVLSRNVNGETVIFELDESVETDIDEPDSYRAVRGGREVLLVYNDFAKDYTVAPLGAFGKVSYSHDMAAQIETDRVWLFGLLDALGIVPASDDKIAEASALIKSALDNL